MYLNNLTTLVRTALVSAAAAFACSASAAPMLQLDIDNGTYVFGDEESVITTESEFTLYALGNTRRDKFDSDDVFHVSVAVTPGASPGTDGAGPDLGSFGVAWDEYDVDADTVTFSDDQVDVTGDMYYGHPPLEDTLEHDGRDLGAHDVFPTYFVELTFMFDENNTAEVYNVQNAGGGALVEDPDGELLFHEFAFNISGLQAGYNLHFDLYHTRMKKRHNDIDIEFFAPFSKDAGTAHIPTITNSPGPTPIPAPTGLLILGLALGWMARRR